MKKIHYIILINGVLLILLLSGCGKKTENISANWGKLTDSAWTTHQSYFEMTGIITENQTGYYYKEAISNQSNDSFNIYYFDKTSRQSTILCNQPNCSHNDDSCTSYIKTQGTLSFQLYGNYLYYVMGNGVEEQDKELYRMSLTGTDKEKVMTICSADEGVESKVWFHDNYLVYYILDSKGITYHVYTINLENNEKSQVGDFKTQGIEDIKFEEGIMVIPIITQQMEDKTTLFTYYLYDFSTGKLSNIISKVDGAGYALCNHIFYYDDNGIIMKYNIEDKTKTEFYANEDVKVKISYDSQYIYVNNFSESEQYILVIDQEGALVDNIQLNQSDSLNYCLFGGDDYLFYRNYNKQTKENDWYYYDKSLIGTGKGEWVLIEPVT